MASPMRVYLRTGDAEYRPLFWLHNNKPNEMLLGFYGLSQKAATLRCMWECREVDTSELSKLGYRWEDSIKFNQLVDHVTCHADGRFHIKTRNDIDLYTHAMQRTQPLEANTSIFLDLMIVSDEARNYRSVGEIVRYPHAWIGLSPDEYLSLRGMFSGSNFAIENLMLQTAAKFAGPHMGIRVASSTIRGVLFGKPQTLPEAARATRQRGTILSFKFLLTTNKWHIKSFLFE